MAEGGGEGEGSYEVGTGALRMMWKVFVQLRVVGLFECSMCFSASQLLKSIGFR